MQVGQLFFQLGALCRRLPAVIQREPVDLILNAGDLLQLLRDVAFVVLFVLRLLQEFLLLIYNFLIPLKI